MPKMKTNSGAKKRFRVNGCGKIKRSIAGKQHGLRRRSGRHLREHGMVILFDGDRANVKQRLPNSGCR
jgi:large subunit ribosomal protein L35